MPDVLDVKVFDIIAVGGPDIGRGPPQLEHLLVRLGFFAPHFGQNIFASSSRFLLPPDDGGLSCERIFHYPDQEIESIS